MSRTKRASRGKGSRKALTVLSVAGMSLAATTNGAVAEISPQGPAPLHAAPLYEEEIFDVSLATFHLFDQERAGANDPLMKYAHGGCGGCGGCHGCGGGGGCHGCGGGGGCHGCAGGMHGCAGGIHGCGGMHGCPATDAAAAAADAAADADGADGGADAADATGVCRGVGAIPGAKMEFQRPAA